MTEVAARPTVRLLPRRHKRVRGGHPWAYSNEIEMDQATKALAPGTLVTLAPHEGAALGIATFSPRPLISARILTRDTGAVIDRGFFEARIGQALALRQRLYEEPYYRLVHAEGDQLPGLVIDRYGDVLVCQVNTAGMERLKDEVLAALQALLDPRVIVVRRSTVGQAAEGLEAAAEVVLGRLDGPVPLEENGVRFYAELSAGQKTGWYYDQRDNRAFVAALSGGCRVLDLYCYAGGFAVQAAARGADQVTAIDRSQEALALAAQAAAANGVADRCRFERLDAFGHMQALSERGERFDIVVADPPAFVKSKKDLKAGSRGYRKMTRLAAGLVSRGGLMLVASCSHNVSVALFGEMVRRGLQDAGRTGCILREAGAGPDHPVHPYLPETAYLKAMVLQLD